MRALIWKLRCARYFWQVVGINLLEAWYIATTLFVDYDNGADAGPVDAAIEELSYWTE